MTCTTYSSYTCNILIKLKTFLTFQVFFNLTMKFNTISDCNVHMCREIWDTYSMFSDIKVRVKAVKTMSKHRLWGLYIYLLVN